jgi:hypothetical protein
MNKRGQVEIGGIFAVIIFILLMTTLIPAITDSIHAASCKNEEQKINSLTNDLNQCRQDLSIEQSKYQNALDGLDNCQSNLKNCEENLANCQNEFRSLQEECDKKEQPVNQFFFMKVYSSKIILFDMIVLYNIHLFGIFLSFGITFTIKLFEVEINIKVLNKRNQRKLVKAIKERLIQDPYLPIWIMLFIVLISNLILLL